MEMWQIILGANSPVLFGIGFLIWRTNGMSHKIDHNETKLNKVAEDVAFLKGKVN